MKKSILKYIEKYQLYLFFILAYCISWSLWFISDITDLKLLKIIGTFGPAISAIIITFLTCELQGLKQLLRQFRIWRIHIGWYLFCFLSTAVVGFMAIGIYQLLTGIMLSLSNIGKWYLIIVAFLYVLFFSVLGEEIGWRGFALQKLQKHYGALVSSIIIGVVWAVWHLPLFFLKNDFHALIPFWIFLIQEVALSIIMTWLFNNTKGSLLIAHLFHTVSNITVGFLPILPMSTNGDLLPLYTTVSILVVFAGVVAITTKAKTMERFALRG